jgi:hypothetical protein
MESASHASSEEELLQLREEGKISEQEYDELLGAMRKPPANHSRIKPPAEPQFQAFRKRVMIGGFIISLFGVIFGLILELPHVWILGIIGVIVAPLKYHLINKHRQSRNSS